MSNRSVTHAKSNPTVTSGAPRVRVYDVLEQAVHEGVAYGWTRAHKHVSKPSAEAICESVEREVLGAVCERFWIENE